MLAFVIQSIVSIPNCMDQPILFERVLSKNHSDRERLPGWRFFLREHLIPFLRWETPYLAAIQQRCRTPTLDAYFAFTANLGTHTFYMVMLPVLIWCGQLRLARACDTTLMYFGPHR